MVAPWLEDCAVLGRAKIKYLMCQSKVACSFHGAYGKNIGESGTSPSLNDAWTNSQCNSIFAAWIERSGDIEAAGRAMAE